MKELGLFLKKQREEKKVTLEEVSVATKIGVKVLQALEDGEEEKLPPKPFVRGFVQAYARYLGLDVKEVLDLYQKAQGASTPPSQLSIPESSKKIERGLPGGARNIITVSLIIILIIAIVIVQRVISKREAEMRGEVSAITGNAEPLNIKLSTSPSPSPSGAESALAVGALPSPSPSPEKAPSAMTKAAADPTATATATPTPTPKPTPTPTPTPEPKPTPTPTPELRPSPVEPKPSASPTVATEESVPQEVIVEALDKVTLKVSIDNKTEKEVTLNPDQIQTFKAKGHIKIVTPDGGAISVIQNGFDLGVPGNLGQPKTMVFPK